MSSRKSSMLAAQKERLENLVKAGLLTQEQLETRLRLMEQRQADCQGNCYGIGGDIFFGEAKLCSTNSLLDLMWMPCTNNGYNHIFMTLLLTKYSNLKLVICPMVLLGIGINLAESGLSNLIESEAMSKRRA